jgi:hypothetical protein
MHTSMYVPEKTRRTAGLRLLLYVGAGVVLLCAAIIVYVGIDVVKDISLVDKAFPGLPSELAGDLRVALVFSPPRIEMDRLEYRFLRAIRYPPLTLPNARLPSADPIGDEIHQAQEEQGLAAMLGAGGLLPLNDVLKLKRSSLDSLGRAIYLSQERPPGSRAAERTEVASIVDPAFERESSVEQFRQIFEIAYGQKALGEATRPDR